MIGKRKDKYLNIARIQFMAVNVKIKRKAPCILTSTQNTPMTVCLLTAKFGTLLVCQWNIHDFVTKHSCLAVGLLKLIT